MNHKKRRAPVKQGKGRNSTKMFRIRISRRRIKRRRMPTRYKKPNHWHQNAEGTYSKIVVRDVELLWLQEHAPKAIITREKVPNCEAMPLYKKGEWDGYATFVKFPKEDLHNSIMFRILWWNTRA